MRNDNAEKEMTTMQKRKILDYVDKRISNFSPEVSVGKDDLRLKKKLIEEALEQGYVFELNLSKNKGSNIESRASSYGTLPQINNLSEIERISSKRFLLEASQGM